MPDFRVNAGELRSRLTLELEELGAASPMGSVPSRFNPVSGPPLAARVTWLSGDNLWQAMQVHPEASVEVLIRWRDDIREIGMRFVDADGNKFYPVNCRRDERRRWMMLLCKSHP